ncbi:ROK family protein, partial [Spirillospora sp. NPDC046719]
GGGGGGGGAAGGAGGGGRARPRPPPPRPARARFSDKLAIGTAAAVLLLDPEIVVLGGGFSRSADVLLPPLRSRLEQVCLRMPRLSGSTLGDECVVLGAIDYAIEHLDQLFFAPDAPALRPPVRPAPSPAGLGPA